VLVAAVGRPKLIRGEDVKPGAVVIDAGYNAGNVGDVDFDAAVTRAGLITPVPGGVGSMTIAVLLAQTVDAAEQQLGDAWDDRGARPAGDVGGPPGARRAAQLRYR
jgi:methylenetetrahydrofolate dehydrogenase (NADP+)/methenyltetrahydrofolate cyclohydrolase